MIIVKNTVQLNGMYGKSVPNAANNKDIFYEQVTGLRIKAVVSINAEQKAKPLILDKPNIDAEQQAKPLSIEKPNIDAKKAGTPPVGLVNKKFDW